MPTVNIDVVIMSSHDVSLVNYIICLATSYPACMLAGHRITFFHIPFFEF